MSMLLSDLVADHKAALNDAAGVFTEANDADFIRHLEEGARYLSLKRPRVLPAQLTLIADQAQYDLPADFVRLGAWMWRIPPSIKPWHSTWPGGLPQVMAVNTGAGAQLVFSPAPTSDQITAAGETFDYTYVAEHILSDNTGETTVRAGDRNLLLLCALIEALRELSLRAMTKPVAVRGVGSGPIHGSPAALLAHFNAQWEAVQ